MNDVSITTLTLVVVLGLAGGAISYILREFSCRLRDIQDSRGCNEEGELKISSR